MLAGFKRGLFCVMDEQSNRNYWNRYSKQIEYLSNGGKNCIFCKQEGKELSGSYQCEDCMFSVWEENFQTEIEQAEQAGLIKY